MKFACFLIPHFPLALELQRRSELHGAVIIASDKGSQLVVDCSEDDVQSGMQLVGAQSAYPDAAVIPADSAYYQDAWNGILDVLEGFSPNVEDGGLGCAYLDVKGLQELYGGDSNLASALLSALPTRLQPRLAFAPSKFAADIASTRLKKGEWVAVPKDMAGYLACFPVSVLPLAKRDIERLRSFGLERLGDIANLPLSAVEAQFHESGRLAWELSRGIDRRPFKSRKAQVKIKESVELVRPLVTGEALLMALETLLGKAFNRKEMKGHAARLALIEAEIPGSTAFIKRIVFKEPASRKEQAFFVLKNVFRDVNLPGPVEGLALTLSGIGSDAGRQGSLFKDVRRRDNLHEAIRELKARFSGEVPIYQVREVEPWSRIPERRRALVPYAP